MGIPLEVDGSCKDHDALDDAPQGEESQAKRTKDDREYELDDADLRIPKVKAVDTQSAQEYTQQTGCNLRLSLRVTVAVLRHGWLGRVVGLLVCRVLGLRRHGRLC